MPKPGDNIHIPLDEEDAIASLLQVKPTEDMPKPGANPTEAKEERRAERMVESYQWAVGAYNEVADSSDSEAESTEARAASLRETVLGDYIKYGKPDTDREEMGDRDASYWTDLVTQIERGL